MSCDIGPYNICLRNNRDFLSVIDFGTLASSIASVEMQVRKFPSSPVILLDLVEAGYLTITGDYEVTIDIPAAAELNVRGYHDIQLTLSNGDVLTLLAGTFSTDQGVSRDG